jgi:large subunit ribosomal protein L23
MHASQIILAPIQSESSFAGLEHQRYSFKVHQDATKTQVKAAIQSIYKVTVTGVATSAVPNKPKRRGIHQGTRSGYKKAVVQLKAGDSIQIFEGVH